MQPEEVLNDSFCNWATSATRLMAAEGAAEQPRLAAVFYTAGRGEVLKRVAAFLKGAEAIESAMAIENVRMIFIVSSRFRPFAAPMNR